MLVKSTLSRSLIIIPAKCLCRSIYYDCDMKKFGTRSDKSEYAHEYTGIVPFICGCKGFIQERGYQTLLDGIIIEPRDANLVITHLLSIITRKRPHLTNFLCSIPTKRNCSEFLPFTNIRPLIQTIISIFFNLV